MHRIEPSFKTVPFAALDSIELAPAPIEPSWIVSGQPLARSGAHSQSLDRAASTIVWDCSAGIFNWRFAWDETVLILDGSVRVTSPQGETIELKSGDVGYFAAGSTWRWEVERYVRKLAFNRRPASAAERVFRSCKKMIKARRIAIAVIGIALVAAVVGIFTLR